MDINEHGSGAYLQIEQVVNDLRMSKKPITIFKVAELTGIDKGLIFQYFYDKGLLRGK